jgi:hypothetical protein
MVRIHSGLPLSLKVPSASLGNFAADRTKIRRFYSIHPIQTLAAFGYFRCGGLVFRSYSKPRANLRLKPLSSSLLEQHRD